MRHFVSIAVLFAAVAAYGEPIDLGCSARGPLAALESSAAFRKAIGDANPANYLGSIYDQNGTQLSPSSFKALRCPLFIDSNATPSASRSKAILNAEVGIALAKQAAQPATTAEKQPLTIFSAAGVVVQLPRPELNRTRDEEKLAPAPEAQVAPTSKAQAAPAGSNLPLQHRQAEAEASRQTQVESAYAGADADATTVPTQATQSLSVGPTQDSGLLSLAQALQLVKRVEGREGESVFVFNLPMALIDFLALFMAILSFSLLIFHPGSPVTVVRSRVDVYRDVLKSVEFQTRQPVLAASRPARVVSVPESGMLVSVGR